MTPTQQAIINDLLAINARLLDAARTENNGRFVQELTAAERCAAYGRQQLSRRAALELDSVDDDDL